MKASVSVIILTLNEEVNIENCLRSVYGWSDDIHVVDSFSKDKTVELAMKYTDKIYRVKEDHWANLRNWTLKNLPLKYDWVLFLDADERLTEDLKKEIVAVLSIPQKVNGFYIKRRFIFMGKWLKHGGLYSKVLRLFKRNFVEYIEFGDSEYAVVRGKVGHLRNDMIHEDRKGVLRWVEKHVKITDREAQRIMKGMSINLQMSKGKIEIESGKRVCLRVRIWDKIPLYLRPFMLFFYSYFLKLGFLDGVEGLVYHLLWSFWYRLLIYIRVLELKHDCACISTSS